MRTDEQVGGEGQVTGTGRKGVVAGQEGVDVGVRCLRQGNKSEGI